MGNKTRPIKRYLAVMNVVLPFGGAVLSGKVLDEHDHTKWNTVNGEPYPAGTIVAAGSTFEAYLNAQRERIWLRMGAVSSPDAKLHFDLEQVFADRVMYLSRQVTLADVLRAHMLTTLEAIADDESGTIPLSEAASPDHKPNPIKASELLSAYGDAEQVAAWLKAAAQACEAPTDAPAPQVTESIENAPARGDTEVKNV